MHVSIIRKTKGIMREAGYEPLQANKTLKPQRPGNQPLSRPFVTPTINSSASNTSHSPLDVGTFRPKQYTFFILFAQHSSLDVHTNLLIGVDLKHRQLAHR
jgi:hypothetical protein